MFSKPNGKTGVAFGLIEGRPGGRIKIIEHNAKKDTGDMDIFDVYKKNCRLSRKYNNAAIYYRAVAPTVIEYVVISDGNFNSDNYLENAIRIDLAK